MMLRKLFWLFVAIFFTGVVVFVISEVGGFSETTQLDEFATALMVISGACLGFIFMSEL